VAHALTISESAFERHTNKSGFRNVFRAARCGLAVQKLSVKPGCARCTTERDKTHDDRRANACGTIEPPRLKPATCWAAAARAASCPEVSAHLTGLRRKARLDRVGRKPGPVMRTGRLSRLTFAANRSRVESESMRVANPARTHRFATESPRGKGLRVPGTAIAIRASQANTLPPGSGSTGKQREPGGKLGLRKRGRGCQCVLRGCGGATEKRMSKKRGE
jgi:hypothetical protein